MGRWMGVIGLGLLLCTGCAAHRITLTERSSFAEVNADLAGREAQLVMKDGREASALDLEIKGDTTSWRNVADSERFSVPTADVAFIKIRKPARGALKGLLYGGGAGMAMASAMYWSDPDEPYQSLAFVFFPALAALVGAPGGALTDADIYEIDFEQPPPEQPGGR